MPPNQHPATTPIPDYPLPSAAKRRKYSHHPPAPPAQPTATREDHGDREEYNLPFLVSSHPSSSHSSPLQPPTPDHSQSSDRSCSAESHAWPILTRLDEIELLEVIEKHAQTYSNEVPDSLNDQHLVVQVSPPFRHVHKLNHPSSSYPVLNSPPDQIPTTINPSISSIPQTPINPHDNKPFKCSLCPKAFTRNYDLTRHKSSHQDQRQHVCAKCGRSFNRRDALIRHTLVKRCGNTTSSSTH